MLEKFFRKVANLVNENREGLQDCLNATTVRGEIKKAVASGHKAPMSAVNAALTDDTFRCKVWEILKMPRDLKMPEVPILFLYGHISANVHTPSLQRVYISSSQSEDVVKFMQEVIRVLEEPIAVDVYSEEDAVYGKSLDPI